MIGIIGGSGLEKISDHHESREIITPYGAVPLQIITINKKEVVFLSRHSINHTIAPHMINYKANAWALKSLSVSHIIATAAVGSLRLDMPPGTFGIVNQFIDFTKNRQNTFFDNFKDGIKHIDMTNPYSTVLNSQIQVILKKENYPYQENLTLAVTEGPRFETSAEIKAYAILGADIVGMTGYPEVSLARELSMEYACLAICTNFAAGIKNQELSHQEVIENVSLSFEKVKIILTNLIGILKDTV
jgi:5'-methylthioadenosine phosphorylase